MTSDDTFASWDETVLQPFLHRNPERLERFTNASGRPIERVYTRQGTGPLGHPGAYPYTRGVQPTMYRGRFWTMRQYAGFSTAEETNRRYRYLLSQGQTGLSVAFDLPTQLGYDSDDPLAVGEVGKVGVAIDTLADLEALFAGIPLGEVTTSMTINAPAAVVLAFYLAAAERAGVPWNKLGGTVQNDILKEYVARGTYIFPPRPSLRLITDLFRFCSERVPRWNTISISGYHIREAGSTAVQEVAFTLANGITYVEEALRVGLEVDAFAPRLSFFFNAHNDLLEEVAKFRAARRLWAKIMVERFGAKDPRSAMLRFHTQTGGSTLTAQQPENNVVRVTLQALAAVLGGTQSLHTNSRDEAVGLPTEASALLALRTQQLIAHESGVTNSVDPLAGSFMVEQLTDAIEAEAEVYLRRIDELGGVVAAIESGFIQQEIQHAAYRYQQEIEAGERLVVGVNTLQGGPEPEPELTRIPPEVEQRQLEGLKKFKAQRDRAAVDRALDAIREAAQGDTNLVPLFVEAAKASASIGEICGVLRTVFGEHREHVVI